MKLANMKDKIVLVTGATAGIGKETAKGIAQLGARVVLVGRNRAKGEAAIAEIKQKTGSDKLDLLVADLSSLAEIRRLADEFNQKYDRLDVLINNAGGIFDKRKETVDNIEYTFALNHLSYFLLTDLLLDKLKNADGARIVSVSSEAHRLGKIDFDDLEFKQKKYSSMTAYGSSKLMNILFTKELARRLAGTNITANCLHPGAVASEFGDNTAGLMRAIVWLFKRTIAITPEKGAETSIYLAASPEVANISGRYFDNKREKQPSKIAADESLQKQLWEKSDKYVNLQKA